MRFEKNEIRKKKFEKKNRKKKFEKNKTNRKNTKKVPKQLKKNGKMIVKLNGGTDSLNSIK